MSTTLDPISAGLDALTVAIDGELYLPRDSGYDAARMPWNMAFDQRPAAVAMPTSARDITEIVLHARAVGLRVAVQDTGHNPGPLGDLSDAILVRTTAMDEVSIDPVARIARVGAGAIWEQVVVPAAAHGLVALRLPPIPQIPEPLRGRDLVVVEVAILPDEVDADAVMAPLRALSPEMDTVARMPAAGLVRLHQDPEGPTPGLSSHAMLDAVPDEAVDLMVHMAGPGSDTPLLAVELRQLGGALARPAEDGGALDRLDGRFAFFALGIPMDAEVGRAVATHAAALARLLAIRARYDGGGLMRANHAIEG